MIHCPMAGSKAVWGRSLDSGGPTSEFFMVALYDSYVSKTFQQKGHTCNIQKQNHCDYRSEDHMGCFRATGSQLEQKSSADERS